MRFGVFVGSHFERPPVERSTENNNIVRGDTRAGGMRVAKGARHVGGRGNGDWGKDRKQCAARWKSISSSLGTSCSVGKVTMQCERASFVGGCGSNGCLVVCCQK